MWVTPTYNFACFTQAPVWKGYADPESWIETFSSENPYESFVNDTVEGLFWMHVACFTLLFLSQFYYFNSLDDCKLSSQSLMQLLTIPINIIVLY